MGRSLALILSTQWKKKRSSKAMRKRQRGDDLVAPEIPLDLQIEIIIRLPIKSLVRFKCISKQWSSLIHSRCFNNGYLRAVSTPRVYISSVEHLDCGLMESSCNNPGKSLLLSLSLSSSENAFNLDLTMQGIGGHNMVVLRGLILYTVCRQACIYNPTTGQSVTLPAVESNFLPREDIEKSTFYYLGYDPVLDQYKVLCNEVIHSVDFEAGAQYWVFVVETGSSWKRIEYDEPLLPTRRGLSINGVIYYLSASVMSPDTLVSFDVRSEEFNMLIAPELGVSVGFIEYGGKPTLVDYTHLVNTGLVDLWVLEDATNWSRKSLVLQPCQKHLVNNNINLWMECSTQNDEIILVPSLVRRGKYPNYILYYDLHKNDLRKVEFRGLSDHFSYPNLQVILMDACESIMRLQT